MSQKKRIFLRHCKFFFPIPKKNRNFATAYARNVSGKKSIAKLSFVVKFCKNHIRRTELYAFACCVCYIQPHTFRRETSSITPVPDRCAEAYNMTDMST